PPSSALCADHHCPSCSHLAQAPWRCTFGNAALPISQCDQTPSRSSSRERVVVALSRALHWVHGWRTRMVEDRSPHAKIPAQVQGSVEGSIRLVAPTRIRGRLNHWHARTCLLLAKKSLGLPGS